MSKTSGQNRASLEKYRHFGIILKRARISVTAIVHILLPWPGYGFDTHKLSRGRALEFIETNIRGRSTEKMINNKCWGRC